jgi:hypothetical protein
LVKDERGNGDFARRLVQDTSTRAQMERNKAMRQVIQACDLALDAVLDQVDIPLP